MALGKNIALITPANLPALSGLSHTQRISAPSSWCLPNDRFLGYSREITGSPRKTFKALGSIILADKIPVQDWWVCGVMEGDW